MMSQMLGGANVIHNDTAFGFRQNQIKFPPPPTGCEIQTKSLSYMDYIHISK